MFGMMNGFMKRSQEISRLERLRTQFKTAEDLGKTECVCCGFCCHRRSCIPSPEETKQIAEYLHISVIELIEKYMVLDTSGDHEFFIKPMGINKLELVGTIPSYEDTYNEGACIFLDASNHCKIHPVKPKAAQVFKCWEKERPSYEGSTTWTNELLIQLYPKAKELINDFNE